MHLQFVAEGLYQLHVGSEGRPRCWHRPQGGVQEVLGADADDHFAVPVAAKRRAGVQERLREDQGLRAHFDLLAVGGDVGLVEVHGRRSYEGCHEEVVRVLVERLGRVALLEPAHVQHRHPVAHRHRLGLVVGDIQGRDAHPALDAGDLRAHLDAQLGIEVGERLVHQKHRRLADDGASHGDALALAAGELARLGVEVVAQAQQLGGLADLRVDLLFGELAQLEGKADVLGHGHVRVQGVVLEDHGHVAVLRGQVVDGLAAHPQCPGGDVLQACHHPESRRLARAGRSDEHHQLSLSNVQVQLGHRRQPVGVDLAHLFQAHSCHGVSLMATKLTSTERPVSIGFILVGAHSVSNRSPTLSARLTRAIFVSALRCHVFRLVLSVP